MTTEAPYTAVHEPGYVTVREVRYYSYSRRKYHTEVIFLPGVRTVAVYDILADFFVLLLVTAT